MGHMIKGGQVKGAKVQTKKMPARGGHFLRKAKNYFLASSFLAAGLASSFLAAGLAAGLASSFLAAGAAAAGAAAAAAGLASSFLAAGACAKAAVANRPANRMARVLVILDFLVTLLEKAHSKLADSSITAGA